MKRNDRLVLSLGVLLAALLFWVPVASAQELIRDVKTGDKRPPEDVAKAQAAGKGQVKTGQFYFPRLQFELDEDVQDKWWVHPIGDQKLREAIKKMSNINILAEPVVVNLDDPEGMSQYPFVFMTSEGNFHMKPEHAANMREYLLRGGFVYADDCVIGTTGDHFFLAFVREMDEKVFPKDKYPGYQMKDIPLDHDVFKCFFQLPGAPFTQGTRHPAKGVFDPESGRLMCMVTSGDIHCGWVGFGNLDQVEKMKSIQMGVNLVVYALSH